ncbi:hypothetical protein [Erwinia oleae]|uniref:hypothetical protein n=1 Tax=Erwinia oleae TaxID=796334 RepID=UPI000ADD05F5|nr:hypothetical protein [Erwinia oleae]
MNPATPEQIKYASDKLVTGELPEGANITKAIVDGYKDGVLIAGAAYLGPAASIGKVVAGATIAEIANGTYQWFDINSEKNQSLPENQQKTWDYKSSAGAAITGALAPGRGVWSNVGIATGGAVFTDGTDAGAIGGAAAGAWAGGMFGLYAPGAVGKITGENHIPEFIYDVIGSGGAEVVGGFTKDAINTTPGNQPVQRNNKKMINYLKLLGYSCVFCCVIYLVLTGASAIIIYLKNGYFFYPPYHVKRTIVFGCISGAAITLAAIVFNLIDKFKSRKTPPSDPR